MSVERVPAPALVLLAIASIQGGSALAVTLFDSLEPLGLLFLRNVIGAVVLCFVYRTAIAGALRRAPLGIGVLGLVMTLQSGAFYEALARVPLGIAASIEFLGPLGVALATSRRRRDVLCVVLAGAGIALLAPEIGAGLDPWGVACAFGAAAGWAAFILIGRRLGRVVEGGVGLALAMVVVALVLLPVASQSAIRDAGGSPSLWPAIVAVALFTSAVPLLFEYLALKTIAPKTYGVLMAVEPVVATAIGLLALGQVVPLKAWIAVGLISIAAMTAALIARAEAKDIV